MAPASYDAYNNWVNMMTGTQVVTFTPSNTVRYTFDTPGYYIVVGDVMPTEAFPCCYRNIIWHFGSCPGKFRRIGNLSFPGNRS